MEIILVWAALTQESRIHKPVNIGEVACLVCVEEINQLVLRKESRSRRKLRGQQAKNLLGRGRKFLLTLLERGCERRRLRLQPQM